MPIPSRLEHYIGMSLVTSWGRISRADGRIVVGPSAGIHLKQFRRKSLVFMDLNSFWSAKAQNAANHLGDHRVLHPYV